MFCSMHMQHFIITPFYVRRHFKGHIDPQLAPLTWLEHRLRLFEDYCLPSVLAQSNLAFEWLIYFDKSTPDLYLDRVRALTAERSNVSILLCDLWKSEQIAKDVIARVTEQTRWIVTTRLDNDDGMHCDFVSNLHAGIEERREFLNFPHGIIFYSKKFYLYRHLSNAFLSLVEPVENSITVWSVAHEQAARLGTVRQLSDTPAFLQVIHDKNVSNKPRGRRMRASEAISGFEAVPSVYNPVYAERPVDIMFENATHAVFWHLRDLAISVVKKLRRG